MVTNMPQYATKYGVRATKCWAYATEHRTRATKNGTFVMKTPVAVSTTILYTRVVAHARPDLRIG